jgi:O-acetylserine/cysteine efflux transporter
VNRSGKDVVAVICLLASIICWGVPPIMLRYMAEQHIVPDGFTTNLIRYPVATIIYIPLLIIASRRGVRLGSFWKWALLPAGINIVGQTLFAIAPYYMHAGIMSFLLRLSTIWSTLLAFILFKDERFLARSPRFWLAAAMAIAGFTLMAIIGKGNIPIGRSDLAGIEIILICSIFWGLYDVTVRHTMGNLNPLLVFGVIGNYTSIGLALLGPAGDPSSLKHLSATHWVFLIGSAYIGIAAAHVLYYVSLQRLGVAVSSVTLLLSPFVTMVGSSIYLREELSRIQWIGGILLIAGSTLALLTRFKSRRVLANQEAVAAATD